MSLIALAGIGLGGYVQWSNISFRFEDYGDYYLVSMLDKVNFQGRDCELCVILEEGETAPTLRQRWLIYKLQRYDSSLIDVIHDAADQHRINIEYLVGDLTEEYGLPVMNRQNIGDHYGIGLIKIPRLIGSKDDFIVLGCGCTWEEEHGMEILVMNGKTVEWHGEEGPWQWETPAAFLEKQK